MSSRSTAVWPAVHTERQALIQDLERLTPEQWARPSLCPGWDVHDVVAHLVESAKTTRLGFVRGLIAARFDFDRANADGLARERGATPEATLAEFRRVSGFTKTPPAAPATRLVEAIVHGEDIRRPLGIVRSYPVGPVAAALRYQLKTGVSMGGGRERAAGFRLRAADAGLDHGSGPEVLAGSLSLLMAVSGRPVSADAFTGDGAGDFLHAPAPGQG